MGLQQINILILGGGISGLCIGYRLKQLGISFQLLEATPAVGGKIQTHHEGSYQLENGPNSLMLKPGPIMDLIEDLGLGPKIVYPAQSRPARYICDGSRLHKITPFSLLTYLGFTTSLRLLAGGYSAAAIGEESVSDFFNRKFGSNMVDKLVSPFVSGIYAGDVEKLIMSKAFPRVWDMDQRHNSFWPALILGAFKDQKKGRLKSGIMTFQSGLEELTNKLFALLSESIQLNSEVLNVHYEQGQWEVKTTQAQYKTTHLISALPAPIFSKLLVQDDFRDLRSHLEKLSYPWLRVLHVAYPKKDITTPVEGFGFLNMPSAKLPFLGCLYSSQLFPHRSSASEICFTIFVGGEKRQDLMNSNIEELLIQIHEKLQLFLKFRSNSPKLLGFRDWRHSIPQYDYSQQQLETFLKVFEPCRFGMHLGSNFLGGVSIPQCVESSFRIAEKLEKILKG